MTMQLIAKVLDAFTDLIRGNIIDHTKPGKERYRPWILKAGIPAGIAIVLLFFVPNTGSTGQLFRTASHRSFHFDAVLNCYKK